MSYHGYHFWFMKPYPKSSENCVYALVATRKRQVARQCLLQTRSSFTQSAMVSMLCLSWGEWSGIDLIFIDARVKINDAYYREVLLAQKLLPVMREICGEFFVFQQGNVPAHRARGTINLLKRDTCFILPKLLPPNSTDLNPINCKNMGQMQQQVQQVHDVDELKQHLIDVRHRFKQSVINDAVDELRKCLCA